VVGVPVFELLAMRSRPLVVKVPVQVPPEPMPLIAPTAAPVVERPEGTPVPAGEQDPEAVVQISILTDLMVVVWPTVKPKVYEDVAGLGAELDKVRLRWVS
jgi:hypothetical protein